MYLCRKDDNAPLIDRVYSAQININRQLRIYKNQYKYNNETVIIIAISYLLTRDTTMAAESLSAMLEKEQTVYRHCKNKCDYLLHHRRSNNNNNDNEATETAVTENARIQIIDWFYSVIDKCQFDRSTVAMATDIMDRYLSVSSNSNSDSSSLLLLHSSLKQFQLVAITCLYIAIKNNNTPP